MNKALFLDRDGTINIMVYNDDHGSVDSPFKPSQFKLARGAKDLIRAAKERNYLPIIVSNQPSVAKGNLTRENLAAITSQMCEELEIPVDCVYYCMHKSEDKCACRKPAIGLFEQAAKDHDIDMRASLMIGDGWNDIAAGKKIGAAKTVLIGRKDRTELINLLVEKDAMPDAFARDLIEAVQFL